LTDLATLVEKTIHECILSFNPKESTSYEIWAGRLEELERKVRAEIATPGAVQLLAQSWSHRVCIAAESGKLDVVLRESQKYLDEFSGDVFPENPALVIVGLHRLTALHMLERHQEERVELLSLARIPHIHGSDLLMLFEPYVKRHSGELNIDAETRKRLIEGMSEIVAESDLLELKAADLDSHHLILALAEKRRKVNEEWEKQSLMKAPND